MSYADPDDSFITWQNHLIDYREPAIEPVALDPARVLHLPGPTLILSLFSLGAIGFAVKPRLLPRNAWIGTAVAGFLGAGLLSSIAVISRFVTKECCGRPWPTLLPSSIWTR
jgi:hypothetical protein